MREYDKLTSTTLHSSALTHHRLKYLGKMAESSEDHISRLALGLSISRGPIQGKFSAYLLRNEPVYDSVTSEKQLRGRTLFKDDLSLWIALVLQVQEPGDYSGWRTLFISHWERGIELLIEKSTKFDDWLEVVASCLTN